MSFKRKLGISAGLTALGGPGGAVSGAAPIMGYAGLQKLQNVARRPAETADQEAYREYQSQLLRNGINFQNQLAPIQNEQLGAIGSQLTALNNAPSADQQANIEIERRRRALATGQEGAQMSLNRGLASRGLSNSAAGLFAQSRADQAQANQLADLESSRLGMQNQFQDLATQRRSQLLGQLGGLQGLVQMPGLESPGERGQSLLNRGLKAFAPVIGAAGGGALGSYFGGPQGGAIGAQAGGKVGGESSSSSPFYKNLDASIKRNQRKGVQPTAMAGDSYGRDYA